MRRLLPILLLCAIAGAPLAAHDFWIEPSTFHPTVGAMFSASLRVGQDFVGDPVPRSSDLIDRFIVRDGSPERAIGGFEGHDPAGLLRVESPGVAVIGYRSRPVPLELPPDKFEQYLKLEGLERILALRAQRGESAKPDKEIFSRCAKAILYTGSGTGAKATEPLGFRLEIVPETNPYAARGPMAFRLVFEGKPLRDALVTAIRQNDPSKPLRARTDAKGRVTFAFPARGVWLIKSVHIIPAPKASGADWESLWASLTFEI